MNNISQTLKPYNSHSEVFSEIKTLSEAFKKHYRKNSDSELVYQQTGNPKMPAHALAVWHDGSENQKREIDFFLNLLAKN